LTSLFLLGKKNFYINVEDLQSLHHYLKGSLPEFSENLAETKYNGGVGSTLKIYIITGSAGSELSSPTDKNNLL